MNFEQKETQWIDPKVKHKPFLVIDGLHIPVVNYAAMGKSGETQITAMGDVHRAARFDPFLFAETTDLPLVEHQPLTYPEFVKAHANLSKKSLTELAYQKYALAAKRADILSQKIEQIRTLHKNIESHRKASSELGEALRARDAKIKKLLRTIEILAEHIE